ncbi:Lysophospholipid acyltransferase [Spironucleus salmonicida]|uniref:Acyltransferase n=1 Tax=Spironucleus salmonicida TaxID=348837 RepID=V6M776_9EUKA|nr:Lysophospholipid acyltransferase [Spironucleus salmonicida]|eukprot:EST49279.1 Acyltransferase [Spironucleus salmonicida]
MTSSQTPVPFTKPFPYEYKPYHPCLHQHKNIYFFQKYITLPLNYITAPIFWPIRVILCFLFMLINSLFALIINYGTDETKPLPQKRRAILVRVNRICIRASLFFTGFILKVEDQRTFKPQIIAVKICNHSGLIDALCLGAIGTECMIANKEVIENPVCKPQMVATRSLTPGSNCVAKMLERRDSELNWPPMTVFSEGAISPELVMIRPRSGTFRILRVGDYVQPMTIRYKTNFNCEWLAQSVVWVGKQLGKNFCNTVKVTYLEPVMYNGEDVQEFADNLHKQMCDSLGNEFVPYNYQDLRYFYGSERFQLKDCTPQYQKDYAWMGRLKDYQKMCQAAGRDSDYEWTKQQLKLE